MILIDKQDDKDSLKYDIDEKFYDEYVEIFGKTVSSRALNIANLLNDQYHDHIEIVLTDGNGHFVTDKDFDFYIEKYLRKIFI